MADDEQVASNTVTDDAPMESSEDAANGEDDQTAGEASTSDIATNADDNEEEEEKSVATSANNDDEEEEDEQEGKQESVAEVTASPDPPPKKKRGKPQIPASARKGRAPAVKGLNIPFRTVKKAMKLDPDIPIVQNEAAIMTTLAAELFLKRLADQSQKICKNRGKNTIRYEDVADARANDPSLAFLKTIIP
mmetsp:Transcript_21970/g.45183  ORF Transcript_21970/g.45183 Transcript_21970/m.45183 type:complete len:192 (+) Transcript_21970:153-728(+)